MSIVWSRKRSGLVTKTMLLPNHDAFAAIGSAVASVRPDDVTVRSRYESARHGSPLDGAHPTSETRIRFARPYWTRSTESSSISNRRVSIERSETYGRRA